MLEEGAVVNQLLHSLASICMAHYYDDCCSALAGYVFSKTMKQPPADITVHVRNLTHSIFGFAAVVIFITQVFISIGDEPSFFHSRPLPKAYDALSINLLKGSAEVGQAIQFERIVHNGRWFMYFGPLPAIVRIIPNLVFPTFFGKWSYLSFLFAGAILLFYLTHLLLSAIEKASEFKNNKSTAYSILIGLIILFSFCLGFELYLLCHRTIYNEAIIWAFACSTATIYYAFRFFLFDDSSRRTLLGLSISSGAALLSRVLFGISAGLIVGTVLICLLLKFKRVAGAQRADVRNQYLSKILILAFPALLCVAMQLWYNYARFESLFAFYSADSVWLQKTMVDAYAASEHHGFFTVKRIPDAIKTYFFLFDLPASDSFPFFRPKQIPVNELFVKLRASIIPLSLCAATLLWAAFLGLVRLIRNDERRFLWVAAGMASLPQAILILSFHALYQRYMFDLLPFALIFTGYWLAQPRSFHRIWSPVLLASFVLTGLCSVVGSFAVLNSL